MYDRKCLVSTEKPTGSQLNLPHRTKNSKRNKEKNYKKTDIAPKMWSG